jgi:DMSO/TMAO reductase YedYZ molybdopterin-dependent catalytic subunit
VPARGYDRFVANNDQPWQEAMRAGLVGRSEQPLNCELPPALLGGEVTPTHRFFRRNHFPIPELDPEAWRLSVAGLVRETLSVSLRDLREMPAQSLTATLECAGNGRALFSPAPGGERWELGAVSTAHWTGARLRDVLDRAGVLPSARELIFRGADGGPLADLPEPIRFERSLGVEDAMRSGALLAYEMNGDPLPIRHGFPVRLVVPGWYAVASVKWLTEVEATDRPFRGFFQDSHYVYEWQRDGQTEREPVRRQRVRAMIIEPPDGSRIPSGDVTVSGVAWSGEAPVRRVDVSAASASATSPPSWQRARLVGRPDQFAWQRWELNLHDLPAGPVCVRARASDAAGNDQLVTPEWNPLGYGGNFVHEVAVTVGLRACGSAEDRLEILRGEGHEHRVGLDRHHPRRGDRCGEVQLPALGAIESDRDGERHA